VGATTAPVAIFGDLDADIWGVVIGGEQARAIVAGLTDADLELQPADLDLEDGEVWTLVGNGFELRVERADATTATADSDLPLEPCRVSGSATITGVEREFDVGGVRSGALSAAGIDSLRLLGSWFPAGHEIALLSTRPHGAKGNDRDQIDVVARGEEHAIVLDPRLSTTYNEHGEPLSVGVELWLGDDSDGEQWPRRVAGAATGSRVGDLSISAYALRCVSRSEPGAGVYLLLRS
jgi:hypothetical protein